MKIYDSRPGVDINLMRCTVGISGNFKDMKNNVDSIGIRIGNSSVTTL